MRSTTTRIAGVMGAVLLVMTIGTGTASAYQSIDKVQLEPGETFKRSYEPIATMNPIATTPGACEDSSACDVIQLDLRPDDPTGFSYRTIVRLSWPDPVEGQNDLDMFLYDESGETEVVHAATQHNPESFGAAYDDDGNIVSEGIYDIPAGTYYIVVGNFHGVNSGYTLEGSLTKIPFDPFRGESTDAKPAQPKAAAPSEPVAPKAAAPASAAPVVTDPGPAPERIDRPGTDGPVSELALPSLSAAKQASYTGAGVSTVTIVGSLLLAAVTILGGVFVGLRIKRELI